MSQRYFSRREFLRLTALGAGAFVLAPMLEACSQPSAAAPTMSAQIAPTSAQRRRLLLVM